MTLINMVKKDTFRINTPPICKTYQYTFYNASLS